MRTIFIFLMLGFGLQASGTTYYVSSSTGNDANSGTASNAGWQTIAHVNAQTFQPGDSILFRRGDVWNESLVPPSSGTSGNPIAFDAYGSGAAPVLTGYYAVPSSSWIFVTGNAWKAPVPSTYTTVNFCLFGSVWGQKVPFGTGNLTAQWDFYLSSGYIYVYSSGNPSSHYNAPIVPMALSNVPVININGKSWLTFQHFLLNWFDDYGVYVQGTSDHLVFANMEADSMIPQGAQPLGFYVNESTPGPGDIKIYNAEAHLNYDGFRFDGTATAITMVNDKAYGNRDSGLVDNTGSVTYSYCHFYGSSLAIASSTDVLSTTGPGPTAGAGNIPQDTAPAVQVWQRYPARVSLTVDDIGMTVGADTYYANTVLPIADTAGVPVGVAITVGYGSVINPIVSEIQGWINAGRDVTSHSISHTYYTNTDALDVQYTGSGTAATLSISGKTLAITVTGAADGVTYNLAKGQAQGTIQGLREALTGTGKFTATEATPCQGPYGTGCSAYTEAALLAQDLADVSGQDVKSGVYSMQLDVTRLTTDEITLSRGWMTTNLTGLPATPVYVYPGGYETTTMQGITAGVPYSGARGALKEDLGVKDTYASGFDVQNITSFGVNPSWQGLAPASLNQKIQALVWKQRVWGVPWGIFWHNVELSSTEVTNLIQDFKNSGATIQSNTALVSWLLVGTQETGTDGNTYYKSPTANMMLDFRPTLNSPVVDVGQNLGTAYAIDINGVNQNSYGSGWEIGAHVFAGYSGYGGGSGGSYFKIGVNPAVPNYAWARTDTCVSQRPYQAGIATPVPSQTGTGCTNNATPTSYINAAVGTNGVPQMWNAANTAQGINYWYGDPQYNNVTVVRMTDGNTTARASLLGNATCSGSGCPKSFNTSSTGSDQARFVNANSTMMSVNSTGATTCVLPIQLNHAVSPPTLAVVAVSGTVGTCLFSGPFQATWSISNPNVLWYMSWSGDTTGASCATTDSALCEATFTPTSGSYSTAPTVTEVWEFAQTGCLGSSFAATWNSEVQLSADDNWIAAGFSNNGGQEGVGAHYIAYYQNSSASCAVLDINPGAVCSLASCPYWPAPIISGTSGWPYYTGPVLGDLAGVGAVIHNINTMPNTSGYAHVSLGQPGVDVSGAWYPYVGSTTGAFRNTWSSSATYNLADTVLYNAGAGLQIYISLVGSNTGNTPSSSPSQWQLGTWVSSTTYPKNSVVHDGTTYYISTASSGNLNLPPASNAGSWSLLAEVQAGAYWTVPQWGHLALNLQTGTLNTMTVQLAGHNCQGYKHIWNSTGTGNYAVRNYISNYETSSYARTANGITFTANALCSYVTCNSRGAWSAGTTYNQYDTVTSGGLTYISLQGSNTGNTPSNSCASPGTCTWWMAELFYSDHASCNSMDANDQAPIFISTVYTHGNSFPSFGYAEVVAQPCATQDTAGSNPTSCAQGGWYRFAPTWASPYSSETFDGQEATGGASTDGYLFCWTSSWLETLGNDSTGSPRSDVFCAVVGAN
jgi:hypothetical protein